MGFPPSGFLIGAEKAGTTTLTYLLAQHPSIAVSNPRDADFFTGNWNKGLQWYESLFNGAPESVFLDVCLSYAGAPLGSQSKGSALSDPNLLGVPERIRSICPDARFIYILRNPVGRTYSSYWHAVRHGYEKRPFREAILANPRYLDVSDYLGQLNIYLRTFSLDSFLLVLFEEFASDPIEVVQRCFQFLGAEPDTYPVKLDRVKNRSFQWNTAGSLLTKIFPTNQSLKTFLRGVKACVPAPLRPIASKLVIRDVPALGGEDREFLVNYFLNRNEQLSELIGRSLGEWDQ